VLFADEHLPLAGVVGCADEGPPMEMVVTAEVASVTVSEKGQG
jgi:hypothetical protein